MPASSIARRPASSPMARALTAPTAEAAAAAISVQIGEFTVFTEAVPRALRGEWHAVAVFANSWERLVGEVLDAASTMLPDLVRRNEDSFGILTVSGAFSEEPVAFLDQYVREAPFSRLLSRFSIDIGIPLVAVDEVRSLLPGLQPFRVPDSLGWPDLPQGADPERFRRLVDLAVRGHKPPLSRVKDLFELNNRELAELFGVKRQAIEQWQREGDVPPARRSKLANMVAVGELLARKLRPGSLPLVARRQAEVYGGRTMLDMIHDDHDDELRDITERAFDWSGTA